MAGSWDRTWRIFYWFVTRSSPVVGPWARRFGLGNVVELVVTGHRTGRRRVVLLGLLQVDREWYLGHPNGASNWTRNLDAAGGAILVIPHQPPIEIRAKLLPPGEERRRVIGVTWRQHIFPGSVLYRLSQQHVLEVGRYYWIERVATGTTR